MRELREKEREQDLYSIHRAIPSCLQASNQGPLSGLVRRKARPYLPVDASSQVGIATDPDKDSASRKVLRPYGHPYSVLHSIVATCPICITTNGILVAESHSHLVERFSITTHPSILNRDCFKGAFIL